MFVCFVCKKNLNVDVNKYMHHLYVIHSLKTYSLYKCTFDDCFQKYSNKSIFKRHLIQKHPNGNDSFVHNSINCLENSDFNHSNQMNHVLPEPSVKICSNNLPISENIYDDITFLNVKENILSFVLNLYQKNTTNRKEVSEILQNITENITKPVHMLLLKYLSEKVQYDDPMLIDIMTFFSKPFSEIDSEYKFIKKMTDLKLFQMPVQFNINCELDTVISNYSPTISEKHIKGVMFPIKFQIQKFFELPHILEKTLSNIEKLERKTTICNFVNGKIWKKIREKYGDKHIIPFHVYMDGFEVNNPLSSHRGFHSIVGVYYSFPTLPVEYSSKLENLFIAMLFKSKDQKIYGNDKCLHLLIKEINSLEKDGLSFILNDKRTTIYFVMGLLLGDNLGVNTSLGFSPSFNHNYCCRLCKLSLKQIRINHPFIVGNQRTKNNYEKDVLLNDYKQTGVLENSIFNSVEHFHVTRNFSVDYMHDLYEGICHYNMSKIIWYLTQEKKFVSLQTLNDRKNCFNYGETEIENISTEIKIEHLKNRKFQMTAREMWCFIHHFTLLIGDLIPKNDRVWHFFIIMLELHDLIILPELDENKINRLKFLATQMNTQYMELFKDQLKFKHHIISNHYFQCILESGPLRFLNCFRYEAKHRELKMYCNNTTSRLNIAYSIAIKMQYKFCYRLLTMKGFDLKYDFDQTKAHKITTNIHILFENVDMSYAKNFQLDNEIFKIKQVKRFGTLFKINFYLTLTNLNTQLFEICNIIICKDCIFLLCFELEVGVFDENLQSFVVNDKVVKKYLINIDIFNVPPIHVHLLSDGRRVFRLKSY